MVYVSLLLQFVLGLATFLRRLTGLKGDLLELTDFLARTTAYRLESTVVQADTITNAQAVYLAILNTVGVNNFQKALERE